MRNSEIKISFKLHMTIIEINATLLLECHYRVFVITSDCDPVWILVKWWEDKQLQLLWGVKKK